MQKNCMVMIDTSKLYIQKPVQTVISIIFVCAQLQNKLALNKYLSIHTYPYTFKQLYTFDTLTNSSGTIVKLETVF